MRRPAWCISEMPTFNGFDHIDTRVRSIAEAEPFYDRLLPELGLVRKTYAFVDEKGEWHETDAGRPYNAIEYHEARDLTRAVHFIGFIEDPGTVPNASRIAFRVASGAELDRWFERLHEFGARHIEKSDDMSAYPAIFFEDPCGTKLEICSRRVPVTQI